MWKINFNAGDALFSPRLDTFSYRGNLESWPEYLRKFLRDHRVDLVALFGDQRPVHKAAARVCKEAGILLFVFEEGYIRPDYITLEPGGVNGHSIVLTNPIPKISRDASTRFPEAVPVGNSFPAHAALSTLYSVAKDLGSPFFRHDSYHKPGSWTEMIYWIRAAIRKVRFSRRDHALVESLLRSQAPFFLVPLQVYNDSQILEHSPFHSVGEFITKVMESFARAASPNQTLLFKHHPLDRGHTDYTALIQRTASRLCLGDRVLYIRDGHLPTLLDYAQGTVTVNSTVGLSSLIHRTATKTLGLAIYDRPGLTAQCSLDAFWFSHPVPDPNELANFLAFLKGTSQINGSFYTGWKQIDVFAAVTDRMAAQYPSHRHRHCRTVTVQALAPLSIITPSISTSPGNAVMVTEENEILPAARDIPSSEAAAGVPITNI